MKKIIFLMAIVAIAIFANLNLKAQVPPIEPIDTDSNGIRNVSTLNHLQWITTHYSWIYGDSFELDNDINAAETRTWDLRFTPIGIGYYNAPFLGAFYGNNHKIDSLYIEYPQGGRYADSLGFISISSGLIKDLALTNCYVAGENTVGALVGSNHGRIENCSSSGYVKGHSDEMIYYSYNIGGLVGYNTGDVLYCHSEADVTGDENIGGLIGKNHTDYYTTPSTIISNCYSAGTVTGDRYVGGLIGYNSSNGTAKVQKCYSISNVYGNQYVGGFLGGSFFGGNFYGSLLENCYAMGRVISQSPYEGIGGFIGYANNVSYVTNCYSQGAVVGTGSSVGGFAGIAVAPLKFTNCRWDNVISGQSASAAGTSTTQDDMFDSGTFNNWDFVNIWNIGLNDNGNYPYLRDVAPVNNVLEPFDTDNDGYRNIVDLRYLRWVSEYSELGWTWNYELDNDIDAESTNEWNVDIGFSPIGNGTIKYTGQFDGNNHIIDRIYINRPDQEYIGLFGYIFKGAAIRNLRLTNCSIIGYNYVGGLVGMAENDNNIPLAILPIENCFTTGNIFGYDFLGGLIGRIYLGESTISGTYVTKSGSKCFVTGTFHVGGLIGSNYGWINNCYSRGIVTGDDDFTAGAIGYNYGLIEKCYSTGMVNTSNPISGLVAFNGGQVIDSYWDRITSNKLYSAGGTSKLTFQMINPNTFVGWDFVNIWECIANENDNYPSFIGVPYYKMNSDNNEINITSENINLNISPNPVSTEAKVTIYSDKDMFVNIFIYNSLGQAVKSCYSGNISNATKEITLNLQNLNVGSYYLIIENNGVLSCKMIVISR